MIDYPDFREALKKYSRKYRDKNKQTLWNMIKKVSYLSKLGKKEMHELIYNLEKRT
jgi:hypothetical protein